MSNKTIKINPLFFKNQNKTAKKKVNKPISYNNVNSNKIKNSFIKKIKEFKKSQANEEKDINKPSKSINSESDKNEFDESIGFISSLLKENKTKKEVKEKIKNPDIHVDLPQTNIPITPTAPTLPTAPIAPIAPINPTTLITPTIQEKSNILNSLNNKQTHKKKIILPKKRKTIKLGKIKNKKIISILIPNQNDKKSIEQFKRNLKNKNINSIKKHLKKHGLIKAGCIAPKNVLREIYENSILAGNVFNNSKETLIHNFMNID